MLTRILVFLGVVLVVVGVLKFLGVIAVASAGAAALIIGGLLLVAFAEYVLGGGFAGRPARRF